jgi:hypothetical protein
MPHFYFAAFYPNLKTMSKSLSSNKQWFEMSIQNIARD